MTPKQIKEDFVNIEKSIVLTSDSEKKNRKGCECRLKTKKNENKVFPHMAEVTPKTM